MTDFDSSDDSKAAILSRKIEELEQLLERAKESQNNKNIPILDDLVEYQDESVIKQPTSQATNQPISTANLDTLLEEIESKIAGELDTLVEILKDTIKDSVMTEIKTRLDPNQASKNSSLDEEGQ